MHGFGELEFNSEGSPIRMIGTIQDITERKKNEEEIKRFNESLEKIVIERTRKHETGSNYSAFSEYADDTLLQHPDYRY